MSRLNNGPVSAVTNLHKTHYGKFLKNEVKIRNLAAADPNSFAAVVVKSVDHFIKARELMEKYLFEMYHACFHNDPSRLVAAILNEFSNSLRASELFAVWTSDLRLNLEDMASKTIKSQGTSVSDLDRDARICCGLLMIQHDVAKALEFADVSRKKYPKEVFFHRIYCELFLYTEDHDAGLKATEEVCKLFPNDANIFHARAGLLKVTIDTGDPDYWNWSRQKKQVELVKEAYKHFLKIAPKDQRQFAGNYHILAYLSLKYSNPSSQMSRSELEELNVNFQNALQAEKDILPCFLPFSSEAKDFVVECVNMHPSAVIYTEGDTCTIDMTTQGMPGRPKPKFPTDNIVFIDMREPTKRRIDVCVSHRELLKKLLSNPASAVQCETDDDENTSPSLPSPNHKNNESDDFEEIILYQMTLAKKSEVFTSKVIHLTAAEDSLYSETSGYFAMVVADVTGDVIKLQLDLGTRNPDNHTLKQLMKKFRFGTIWSLKNPDFRMDNGDENTIYMRAVPDSLIPITESQNYRKCRYCFKILSPGRNCGKCKRATYCGKECQTQDWKFIKHHFICSEAYNDFFK